MQKYMEKHPMAVEKGRNTRERQKHPMAVERGYRVLRVIKRESMST
jgi:hypothetical protein